MTKSSNKVETTQNLDLSTIPEPTDPRSEKGIGEQTALAKQAADARTDSLTAALGNLGLSLTLTDVRVGNNLARYTYVQSAKTVFSTNLTELQNGLANLLGLHRPPMIRASTNTLEITIDNDVNIPVDFRRLILRRKNLPAVISAVAGADMLGNPIDFELGARTPHAILFGRAGSGKTSMITAILYSIMNTMSPDKLKIAYIDGRGNAYNYLKNDSEDSEFCHPNPFTYTEPVDADADLDYARALIKHLERETQKRTALLKQKDISNLADFNEQFPDQAMPEILLVVDEFSAITYSAITYSAITYRDRDFKTREQVLRSITDALTFMIKAAGPVGIHLFLANQTARKELVPSKLAIDIPIRLSLAVSEPVETELALPESKVPAHFVSQPGEFYAITHGGRNPEHGSAVYLPDDVRFALNDSLEKKFGHRDYVVSRQAILAEMNDN